jgi:hypothetical protein
LLKGQFSGVSDSLLLICSKPTPSRSRPRFTWRIARDAYRTLCQWFLAFVIATLRVSR